MTRLIYVEEAEQARISEGVAKVVREMGGVVDTHTPSVVEFEHLNPGGRYSFSKAGYVGIYQRFGERGLELVLQVFAVSPYRLFWTTVVLELLVVGLIFGAGPPIAVWFLASLVLWAALVAAALIYLGTWYSSRQLEAEMLDRVRTEVGRGRSVLTPMELEEKELRARVLAKARISELKAEAREQRRPSPRGLELASPRPRGERPGLLERLRGQRPGPSRPPEEQVAPDDSIEEKPRGPLGMKSRLYWTPRPAREPERVRPATPRKSPLSGLAIWRKRKRGRGEGPADDDPDAKRRRLDELKRRLQERGGSGGA